MVEIGLTKQLRQQKGCPINVKLGNRVNFGFGSLVTCRSHRIFAAPGISGRLGSRVYPGSGTLGPLHSQIPGTPGVPDNPGPGALGALVASPSGAGGVTGAG